MSRLINTFARHWLWALLLIYGIFVWLPFLAPVLMEMGYVGSAEHLYFIYRFFCHQLPQRSYFLFGEHVMYDLPTIQAAYEQTTNPMILRRFVGTEAMGWKIAWSDRMISFYGGIWLWLLVWLLLPRRPRFSFLTFILLGLPMVINGFTHMISDTLSGIDAGFRYDNAWLATLTNHAFMPGFYAGDAVGSFNFWLRIVTGLLFSLGLVWWAIPLITHTRTPRYDPNPRFTRR